MRNIKRIKDIDIFAKRLLIRLDLNVPVKEGQISSAKRIEASLPLIKYAIEKGAKVILMSHMGRPNEGEFNSTLSLAPVATYLSKALKNPVPLICNYLQCTPQLRVGEVILLENVRFNVGELSNDTALSKQYASLCEVFVMDAFGTAHRAQASTYGVGMFAPIACAGPLLENELNALETALFQPVPPTVAIVGGSKVLTKLTLLSTLITKVKQLILGGGIANTFIAAAGFDVGKSLYEPEFVPQAKALIRAAKNAGSDIPIPLDVVTGKSFDSHTPAETKWVSEIEEDDMVLDVGPQTIQSNKVILHNAGTILWNGPVGVFEFDQFANGTKELGEAVANSSAFSVAGGGDTLAAIEKYQLNEKISYISTGGGAFLKFLEGKKLPAIEMLEQNA